MSKKISLKKTALDLYKSGWGMLFILILMWILMSVISPHFMTAINMTNMLRQVVTTGFLACGMTCVLIIGVIDLSQGSQFAIGGVVTVLLINEGVPFLPAVLAGILFCSIFGAIFGLLVSYTGIPAFIITLAGMNVLRGLAYILCGGLPHNTKNETFYNMGNGMLFGKLPWAFVFFILTVILLSVMLKYTVFGRHMYATGGNFETAVYSGINVKKVRVVCYMISGALAGLAGIFAAARVAQGQPSTGVGFESDAVAAAVLGGTSFNGGSGTMWGTLIGSIILATLNNSLNLLGVSYYSQLVVKGILIVVAVYLDTRKNLVE